MEHQTTRIAPILRIVGIGAVGMLVASCPDDGPLAPPALNERLGPTQSRAGRILDADALLGGDAKARIGDFKLYNSHIAITIASASGADGFHPYGGTILDADIIRTDGSSKSTFGEIIWSLDFAVIRTTAVEVIENGENGPARIRTRGGLGPLPLYDALLGGILPDQDLPFEWTIDYVLEPGSNIVRIEHELFNTGRTEEEASPLVGFFFGTGARPFFERFGFSSSNSGASSAYYAAASDDVSYLFFEPESEISVIFGESGIAVAGLGETIRLRARERRRHTQFLVVSDGDLAKTRAMWRRATSQPQTDFVGRVVDESGAPVPGAHVHVIDPDAADPGRDYVTRTTTDDAGRFTVALEDATMTLVATSPDGRISAPTPVAADVTLSLPAVGIAVFRIVDDANNPLPAKVSLERNGQNSPTVPSRYGERDNPDGFDRVVFAIDPSTEFPLVPSNYTVYVSRGIEYEVVQRSIEVVSGERVEVEAVLARSVDSAGWMTSDPHLHAQRSPDSADSYDLKTRALLAENIELPVSTDHEAVGDFNPSIAALGMANWIHGIVGTEITTTRFGHFNTFPIDPTLRRVDWYGKDPVGFFAAAHELDGEPIVQVNHPRSTTIGYFELLDLDRKTFGGDAELSFDFDGIEVINECGDGSLDRAEVLDWFAFLSRGDKYFATGTMDDHNAGRGRIGVPLTYVGVEGSSPGDVTPAAYREAYVAGRLAVTCGPFVTATIQGGQIGSLVEPTNGRIEAQASVMAAGWVDVDEVLLIVDGVVRDRQAVAPGPGGLRFSGTLSATVAEDRDTWAIIWARGDEPHGPWAQGRPSFGFTNAVFVDGNRDGRYF